MKLTAAFENDLLRELGQRLSERRLPSRFLEALPQSGTAGAANALSGGASPAFNHRLETIIRAHRRPSLLVQDNRFEAPVSETWGEVLEEHRPQLDGALPAVGRIELSLHPQLAWAGTGFLVADDIVVTNRHVAHEFARQDGVGFSFRSFSAGQVRAQVDFLAEHQRVDEAELAVVDIVHLEDESGPDMAFLRIEPSGRTPLELATSAEEDDLVAVIGYPWKETRVAPEIAEAMERIFQDIYDVKRLAPGKITGTAADHIKHDCSSLAGNSGSAVVDIETGEAVALHYLGGVLANFAVPAATVEARLQALL